MKIQIRSSSYKAIISALEERIKEFPDTDKGYNQSRKYRLALKEIKKNK